MLRPLRALRLLRLFDLARAGVVLVNALKRVREILTHRGLHFVLLAAAGIVVVASGVELVFEEHAHGANIHNFGESLWWAIVTVTTAGRHRADRGAYRHDRELLRGRKSRPGKADLSQRLERIEEMLAQFLARQDKTG